MVRLTHRFLEPQVRQLPILPPFFVRTLPVGIRALAIGPHLDPEITQLFQHQPDAGIEAPLARSVSRHGHTLSPRATHFNCATRDTYNGHHHWYLQEESR